MARQLQKPHIVALVSFPHLIGPELRPFQVHLANTMGDSYFRAHEALTFARDHLFEREAVADQRAIMTVALRRSMGEATFSEFRDEFLAQGRGLCAHVPRCGEAPQGRT